MSKRDRSKSKGKTAEETAPVADPHGAESAEANGKLADFAKGQAAKVAKEKVAKAAKAEKVAKEPKLDQSGVRKLPPLPRKASASNKPLVDCGCGCGVKTKSKFAPGHDSRLRGWSLRIARGLCTLDEIVTKFEGTEGEKEAVAAHIKQLKKDSKWDDLKNPQVTPKKKAVSE